MIKVHWMCNLDDVSRYEKFPEYLSFRPMVDDIVRSSTKHPYNRVFELKVHRCYIRPDGSIEVDLHLIGNRIGHTSVSEFEKWYRNFRSG